MSYHERACALLETLRNKNDLTVLAVESSCDETACAVIRGGELLSNVIASQIEIHKRYGGVVPEIASRNHTAAVMQVVNEAIYKAEVTRDDIDAVAVTYGSGLLGALLVGVAAAKSLAFAWDKPLIAVNHIFGHICANYLSDKSLKPPYLCLLVSGGHTAVIKIKNYTDMEILGETADDACGEAFDKAARVLGLPYPGGVQIEKLAANGKPNIELPTPFKGEKHYNFSFSGLKTAVINTVHNAKMRNELIKTEDIACSFQEKAVDILVNTAIRAAVNHNLDCIAIAGGVGANGRLRERMRAEGQSRGIKIIYPTREMCTDNAAMIAAAASVMIKCGAAAADLNLDACANVPMNLVFKN